MKQNPVIVQLIRVLAYLFLIIFVVLWTKAYLGYFAIQETIKQNYTRFAELQTQFIFTKNFYIPYLKSDYAWYFVNHEHWFANNNEVIIKFIKQPQVHIPSIVDSIPTRDSSWELQWGWKEFMYYKRNRTLNR